MTYLTRRHLVAGGLASSVFPAVWPTGGVAQTPRETMWEDLIPLGVPYSEIIGEGEMDEANDIWKPVYDANAMKFNQDLEGKYIRMPGFIIPIEIGTEGVSKFILVPYVGACIHTPPPPPNQLVFVDTATPWPGDQLWDAVWVTGTMRTQMNATEIAETGYALAADHMEVYVW